MALCPFAVHELLPENSNQNRINPTTVICHRAVSSAKSLYGYWNSPGVELESHFYIDEQGTIYQYMDTNVRADANVRANAFAVSIETWDGGNTPDSMGWNAAQVAALKRLIKWICDVHGIKKSPAQTWNGGGIGGHNWFPTEWADGPRGCPGSARNAQLRNDIIPAVASGDIGGTFMALTAEQQKYIYEALVDIRNDLSIPYTTTGVSTGNAVKYLYEAVVDIRNDLAKPYLTNKKSTGEVIRDLENRLEQLEDKIDSIAVGDVDYNALADRVVSKMLQQMDIELVRKPGS